jgi:vesicle transport through interaction with t-SNAREs protein 1
MGAACDTSFIYIQIRKMDLEARSLQPSTKAGLLAKLREYKSDLNDLKSELKRISAPNARQATREELLESGMADTLAVSSLPCSGSILLRLCT